ncbi:FtsX-like permease family protein [Amycolatopsis acidiphila]|uniref:FtsX-like permease family protein n=1 Tax=Amycolatopsis acidiphila TaxID=715473 RepID=A0A558AN65_9PSEU|nr:FtsX-like permease family protein [Amycolatopsis acidiphila]TVT25707.1 FtsX-like permease family protein [Amycolatopsis acidiphila]UIJ60467.1 FtsX-like permease family protein [Amycolatopsis acidiphila]GHG82735.1 hypothetical protein GCM10017788_53510 [Amycolatopsis acidiphila]
MNRLMDLALGVRLAVGGGRTLKAALLRLVLTTIGIGLATAVLLLVVTAASALSDRGDRLAAREPDTTATQATPLYLVGGQQVDWDTTVDYVEPAGPGAPVPPGLAALPGPGQIVVSPALAAKIAADPKTRAMFSQQIVGTIGRDGLAGPNELRAYAGATGLRTSRDVESVYGFGKASGVENLPPQLIMLGTIGVLVLLIPMLVFVASSSRIAGAERERRLSALRLAGAGAAQVRRIAAAEALVGAAFGALLGLLLFLVVRPFAASVEVSGVAVFPADFVPMWQLVVVVFVLIPVITVGTAWLGLRGLIVEPLAVFRRSTPVRRRLWWRLLLVVLGVLLLLPDKLFGMTARPSALLPFVLLGTVLLLIGVPTFLPWVTERVVGRLRGGFPAWQLAVRRLQLDSGTPSRVIAGVVVVLAAVIALQTLLGSVNANAQQANASYYDPTVAIISVDPSARDEAIAAVGKAPAVKGVYPENWVSLGGPSGSASMIVAPCPLLEHDYRLPSCSDGDVFRLNDSPPGASYQVREGEGGSFTVPAAVKTAHSAESSAEVDLLATPGVAPGVPVGYLDLKALIDPTVPDGFDQLRAAVATLEWRASVVGGPGADSTGSETVQAMQGLLYAGALLTMVLAGISMLVMIVGQISERRRPLAAMSAAGVSRGVLGRSLLWQNAIPVVFGVLVAVGAGVGIAALMLRVLASDVHLLLNGPFIVLMACAAVVLVVAVTGAALPGLRSATKLEALRME